MAVPDYQRWDDAARHLECRADHRGRRVCAFTIAPFCRVEERDGVWWTVDFLGRALAHAHRLIAEEWAEASVKDWLTAIRDCGA